METSKAWPHYWVTYLMLVLSNFLQLFLNVYHRMHSYMFHKKSSYALQITVMGLRIPLGFLLCQDNTLLVFCLHDYSNTHFSEKETWESQRQSKCSPQWRKFFWTCKHLDIYHPLVSLKIKLLINVLQQIEDQVIVWEKRNIWEVINREAMKWSLLVG